MAMHTSERASAAALEARFGGGRCRNGRVMVWLARFRAWYGSVGRSYRTVEHRQIHKEARCGTAPVLAFE